MKEDSNLYSDYFPIRSYVFDSLVLMIRKGNAQMYAYTYKSLSYGLVLFLCLVSIAACSPSSGGSSSSQQSVNPIRIGASISLTGDFSDDGKALQRGYQLWQEQMNASGGLLGRNVQFDFLNDASSQSQVNADYNKFISVNHDDLVLGPFSTPLTAAASTVANHYKYAFLEGAGTAPKVFEQRYTNLFSVSLSATSYLKSFVFYLLALPQNIRPKTVAYVTTDDFFTYPQIDAARPLLEDGGIRTVLYDKYPATTTDFNPIATRVIMAHPDVVMIGSTSPTDSIPFMKVFKQQHFNPSAIIATAGPDQGEQFTGPLGGTQSAEGIFVPNSGWFPQVDSYQNSQFTKSYISKFGGSVDEISYDTVEAYSACQVLEQAVKKIGSIDNTKLIAELHSDTFSTIEGPVKFTDDGQNSIAVAFLFQWQAGHLEVVYPSSSAQKNPEFPKQSWP